MIAFDVFNFSSFTTIFVICLFTIFGLAIRKKFVHGILDPWFPTAFNQMVFTILLTVLFLNNILSLSDYFYWILATIAFLFPFLIKTKSMNTDFQEPKRFLRFDADISKLTIVFVGIYQLIADSLFVYYRGIPLFYETGSNPQIYVDGFGFIKYLHDSVKIILPPLAVYHFYSTRKLNLFVFAIFISLYPSLLFEWSKVGILTVSAYFWFSCLYFFGKNKILDKSFYIILLLASLFVIFMFARVALSGYGENAIDSIIIRLIQSIDGPYFYFVEGAKESFLSNISIFDYIFSLISPFFGYEQNVGNIGHEILIAAGQRAEDGYGPSPSFQLVGYIFFGYAGILYSFTVGATLSYIVSKMKNSGGDSLVLWLIIYFLSINLAGDISLFLYYLFTIALLAPSIMAPVILMATLRSDRFKGRLI